MDDYEPMLKLADELQTYRGYLDSTDQGKIVTLRQSFDQKRREFIYRRIRRAPDHSGLWFMVSTELNRIKASGEHYPDAVDFVRAELETHIAKQVRSHPIRRLVTRWALPGVAAALAIAHLYTAIR